MYVLFVGSLILSSFYVLCVVREVLVYNYGCIRCLKLSRIVGFSNWLFKLVDELVKLK